MAIARYVGAHIKRMEDPRLIRGEGTYLEDLRLPGMAYAAVFRSMFGHARVTGIDTSRAQTHPGVLAVLTADDFGDRLPVVPGPTDVDHPVPPQFILAKGRVRYLGEPVAVVVAEDRYTAVDALSLIDVSYEPLPCVTDPAEARRSSSPLVHDELATNVAYTKRVCSGNVDAALASAAVRIRQRMLNQRLAAISLEGRAVAAEWRNGSVTMWNSTQVPHELRDLVASGLGLSADAVRVVAPDVGGGFGPKLHVYPEDLLIPLAAKAIGRPVQWAESRREHLAATSHGRGQIADVEIGAAPDGTILALKVEIAADLGAYLMRYTALVPTITLQMIQGPYLIENIDVTLTGVYTNKVPTGPYRGAGRPEATYYLERAIDMVAREVGRDPAAVRERNFIPASGFPHRSAAGPVYDSGHYEGALRKALAVSGYEALRDEQRRRRANGGRLLGIGLSSYVEICGFGPNEYGAVRINEDASVEVLSGTSPHGQGGATSLAQIAADMLCVPLQSVKVVSGDTKLVPVGHGTGGSRTMAVGGSAVWEAAHQVREQVVRVAAYLLEASPADIVLDWGGARVAGVATSAVTLAEIARAVYQERRIPPGMAPELAASHDFVPPDTTFPFGTHVCVVEADSETGAVRLLRYIAVDDCGTVINPLLVAGQLHGGIAQGIAQALFEEVVYDGQGQMLTGSLVDYAVPKATMLPTVELAHTVTPSPHNPLGIKGVGEAGTIGATAAVTNAVIDALAGFGIRHLDMPLTSGRLWDAMRRSRAADDDGRRS